MISTRNRGIEKKGQIAAADWHYPLKFYCRKLDTKHKMLEQKNMVYGAGNKRSKDWIYFLFVSRTTNQRWNILLI